MKISRQKLTGGIVKVWKIEKPRSSKNSVIISSITFYELTPWNDEFIFSAIESLRNSKKSQMKILCMAQPIKI